MISKESIELILGQNTEISSKVFSASLGRAVAIPDSMTVVDLEKYLPNKSRYSGKFSTEFIGDFCDYVDGVGTGVCFIDRAAFMARAILDIGTVANPEHCEHIAVVALQDDPIFTSFQHANGLGAIGTMDSTYLSQSKMVELLSDYAEWLEFIETDASAGVMDKTDAIGAIRCVEISSAGKQASTVQNFSVAKTASEELVAKGGGGQKLPSKVVFTTAIKKGLDPVNLGYRIQLKQTSEREVDDRELRFRLVPILPETQKLESMNEFATMVKNGISSEVSVVNGSFSPR